MPKISVIIPVYKVEQYLRQCLDSVIAQTFKDIEVICVDDGSPDNCPQILEEYAAMDSRIRVIHQENKGQAVARNVGIERVTGEYVLFVDSDDWIELDLLEKVLPVAEKGNADMTFFFVKHPVKGHRRILDSIGRIVSEHTVFDVNNIPFCDAISIVNYVEVWSKLWKSDFVKNNNIKFFVAEHGRGTGGEDVLFHWIALLHGPKFAIVPYRLYQYRLNPNSSMNNPKLKYANSFTETCAQMKNVTVSTGLYHGKWKELFFLIKIRTLARSKELIEPQYHKQCLSDVLKSIDCEEREYLSQSKNLPVYVKDFYRALDGSVAAKLRNMLIWNPARRIVHTIKNTIRLCKNFSDWRTN